MAINDIIINFSIVIPHKNTPELLRKCLDSIPQDDDIQIIIIDDNSDSDVVDFSKFPGIGEDRTEVYLTKEGYGPGYARNIGLQHAIGKWILFADSDDFFHSTILKVLDFARNSICDIIFFKPDSINLFDGTKGGRGVEYANRVDEALKNGNFQPILMYSSPCCKLINRAIIEQNNIRFPVIRYGEDVVFMAKIAINSNKCLAIDEVAYCISCNNFSITSRNTIESNEIRLQQDLIGIKFYKDRYTLTKIDKYWYFHTWYNLYRMAPKKAYCYFGKMFYLLGSSFVYNFVKEMLKNIKRK